MLVDFHRIKHFSMTYVFMDDDCMDAGGRAMQEQLPRKDIACEYEQTAELPVVALDASVLP